MCRFGVSAPASSGGPIVERLTMNTDAASAAAHRASSSGNPADCVARQRSERIAVQVDNAGRQDEAISEAAQRILDIQGTGVRETQVCLRETSKLHPL